MPHFFHLIYAVCAKCPEQNAGLEGTTGTWILQRILSHVPQIATMHSCNHDVSRVLVYGV